jgi:hypothetical protein
MVKKSIILFIVALFVAVGSSSAHAKTFYLDGNMSSNITNGTYSIENRNSSGSNGDAYNNIQDAINQLAPGTLFLLGVETIPVAETTRVMELLA